MKIIEKNELEKCFIIAEAGINHNGDIDLAKKMVESAKECGADAIKFQSFSAESLLSNEAISSSHTKDFDIMELVNRLELSVEDHRELFSHCKKSDIEFLSTPTNYYYVDLLDDLGVNSFKIASCDINHVPLIRYISSKNKPIIMSTGMASVSEISNAVETIYSTGNRNVSLLHCVSLYPPKIEDLNLRFMRMLRRFFRIPVGFSDHTVGTLASVTAMAMGASIIEKHFTLDKNMPGPDQKVSADPEEMKIICDAAKKIPVMKGNGKRKTSQEEQEMKKSFRRSIVAKEDIEKHGILKDEMLDYKRPGTGISPDNIDWIIGRTVNKDIKRNNIINKDDLI